jgi:hypothetical protein
MNRRNLLKTAALMVPVGLFAAACGLFGGTTPPTPAQIAQGEADVQLVDQALVALEQLGGKVLGTSDSTLSRYAGYITQAGTVATAIIAAGGAATTSQLQTWETYVNAGIGALSTALGVIGAANPLVATISGALAAASVLLPVIETAFNVFLTPTPVPAVVAADHAAGLRFATGAQMTPEQARQVLGGVLAMRR